MANDGDGSGDIIKTEPMDLNDDNKVNPDDIKTETMETAENGHRAGPMGKVVQVTNVSPGATLQQLATLFGFIGTVNDIRLYPIDEAVPPVQVKVCYIKYENNEQCGVAQHLTNTVFIDKALIVVPINREEVPEESDCQHLIKTINAYATMSATGYLSEEGDVVAIPGLPPPPVITHSTDPVEIEEIKRTIFVSNIDLSVQSEQLMAFFSGVGEIKYMRLSKLVDNNKHAFIEFSGQESVTLALQYSGVIFGGQCLKVEHAKSPIVKPESERIATGRSTQRGSRDVVKRPSSANWDSTQARPETKTGRRERSRSRSRKRSLSRGRSSRGERDRARRSKSRSKSRKKSRSRSPARRKRTPPRRQRSRSRTRTPPRRRSRSRSKSPVRRKIKTPPRRRSRSRSKSPVRRKRRSKSRSRSPTRRKSRRSPSKSPDKSKKKRSDDKDKKKDKKEKKDSKEKEKEKEKDKDKVKVKEEPTEGKDLKSLLDKVYTYEEEKEKEKQKSKEDKEKEKEAEVKVEIKDEIDWKDI